MSSNSETSRGLTSAHALRALEGLSGLLDDAAVFVVDAQRRIVHWSEGATRLLGHGAAEVLGQHCLVANRCDTCVRGCGIEERGQVRDVPLTLYDKQGRAVPVRKRAQAFFDADGKFAGGVELLMPAPGGPRPADPAPRGARDNVARVHGIVTQDPGMLNALQTLRTVAATDSTVLIRGESGTGKELVARAIHAESHRARGPFVAVNCAALTPSLLESELFGHVRGAFTGAVSDREGLFVQASGGTLFLDEVAELPLDVQAKLLRVLEEGEVTPVGGAGARRVDVRVLAATHRSLRRQVAAGKFREDLMYRLRVVPIFLPPLRERPGDVELLLSELIAQRNQRGGRRVSSVSPDAMRALLAHRWPGNVRELRNVVEHAFAVGQGPVLRRSELPPEYRAEPAPQVAPASPEVEDEAARIKAALAQSGGHIGRAAALLGVSRPTLWRKRKKLGL